jgi:hypothetical protein
VQFEHCSTFFQVALFLWMEMVLVQAN